MCNLPGTNFHFLLQNFGKLLKKEEGNENVNVRVIAIEKCLVDADEKETFKILSD